MNLVDVLTLEQRVLLGMNRLTPIQIGPTRGLRAFTGIGVELEPRRRFYVWHYVAVSFNVELITMRQACCHPVITGCNYVPTPIE
jgi:hypothetical protein